jgi:hypothetical protein
LFVNLIFHLKRLKETVFHEFLWNCKRWLYCRKNWLKENLYLFTFGYITNLNGWKKTSFFHRFSFLAMSGSTFGSTPACLCCSSGVKWMPDFVTVLEFLVSMWPIYLQCLSFYYVCTSSWFASVELFFVANFVLGYKILRIFGRLNKIMTILLHSFSAL